MREGTGLAAAFAVAVLCGSGACAPEPTARTHVVEVRDFEFSPGTLEVAAGDSIVWVNRDVVPHAAADPAGAWDSGEIRTDSSWSWVAQGSGRIDYVCPYHPTMRGSLVVE